MKFSTSEAAYAISNDSRHGLSAYIFTNDIARVMHAECYVDLGKIYINRIGPESLQGFHAGDRQSGVGGDD